MIGIIMAGGRGIRMAGPGAIDSPCGRHDGRGPACGEKLLFPITDAQGGQCVSVVEHAIGAAEQCGAISSIHAVVSEANAPRTRRLLADKYNGRVEIVDSDGAGYSQDLGRALRRISAQQQKIHPGADAYERGAIIMPGDMPYMDAGILSVISAHYAKEAWTGIVITKEYAAMWDASFEYAEPICNAVIHDYDYGYNDYNDNNASRDKPIPCCHTGISLVDPLLAASQDMTRRHVIMNDHRIAHSFNTPDDYASYQANGQKKIANSIDV